MMMKSVSITPLPRTASTRRRPLSSSSSSSSSSSTLRISSRSRRIGRAVGVVLGLSSSVRHMAVVDGREWKDIDLLHHHAQLFGDVKNFLNPTTTTTEFSFPLHVRAQDVYEIDPFQLYAQQQQEEDSTGPGPPPSQTTHDDPPNRTPFEPNDGGGDLLPPPSPPPTITSTSPPPTPPPPSPVTAAPSSNRMGFSENERFPQNPVPLNPPRGYFNYDLSANSLNGPGYLTMIRDPQKGLQGYYQNNAWKFVEHPPNSYWREFSSSGYGTWKGALARRHLHENSCGNTGRQSPIDVRLSGVACVEHHQIRPLKGDFRISGSAVDKRIEHNKLRLVWERRPCSNTLNPRCAEPDPPPGRLSQWMGGGALPTPCI